MKTETTISHACKAVGLVLDGAIAHIESDYGPMDPSDRAPFVSTLFDEVHRRLLDYDVPGMTTAQMNLVNDMEVLLDPTSEYGAELMQHLSADPEVVKTIVLVLLSRHDLMP